MNIYFLSAIIFSLGLALGSFANVCIYRLPLDKQISKGRSFCPNCKVTVKVLDNIPLISYLFLNGKCRKCKKVISFRYFFVEFFTGLTFLSIFLFFENYYEIIFLMAYSLVLFIIFFIDLEHYIIPDGLNFILVILAFIKNFLPNFVSNFTFDFFLSLLGGLVGFLIIYLIIIFYKKFKNMEAMGLGDAKYMISVGLLFGPESVFFVLFYSAVLGLIFVSPSLINKTKNLKSAIPFGPFLIIATIIYYFTGNFLF